MIPIIMGICPTYKRPDMLTNVVACHLNQDFIDPEIYKSHLVILDDAGQYHSHATPNYTLHSQNWRYDTLPQKFNALISLADKASNRWYGRDPDIYAVIEDDDIYLPFHYEYLANSYVRGHSQFFAPSRLLSDYEEKELGKYHEESAVGRFHSSWAYSKPLIDACKGYPETDELNFDMQMHGHCLKHGIKIDYVPDGQLPSVVYRWGKSSYHGSQTQEYQQHFKDLELRPFKFVHDFVPELDRETKLILADVWDTRFGESSKQSCCDAKTLLS